MVIEIAAAQVRPKKADLQANIAMIGAMFAQLEQQSPPTDLLVLPETALSGYFVEGGVRDVAREAGEVFSELLRAYRASTTRPGAALDVVVGFYELFEGKYFNSGLYATLTSDDSGAVSAGIRHVHRKFFLPTYGVFDEKRFVSRGRSIDAFETRFGRAAVLICEDVWHSVSATIAALKGAQLVIVLSASPGREFVGDSIGNLARWDVLLHGVAEEHGVFVVYAGLVGFEGGKGFTGSSRVVDPWGRTLVKAPVTADCMVRARVDLDDVAVARAGTPLLADLESTLTDIVLQFDAVARRPYALREGAR